MRRRITLVCALAATLTAPAVAQAQKLVYVVRHAERADDPARNEQDPPLSTAGERRAARLAVMLGDAGIRGIYVTQFQRTQQTAGPIASKLKIKPDVMPATITALVADLKGRHANDVVLLVAHSSTMPGIIRGFGGPAVDIDDADYDSLFVVVPSTGTASRIRF